MSINTGITAIQDAMTYLGIAVNDPPNRQEVNIFIRNKKNGMAGNGTMVFEKQWHNPEGPHISIDEPKGFGLQFEEYKPRFYEITFDKDTGDLAFMDSSTSFTVSLAGSKTQ